MSQDELASRMGYKSRSSINKIEMGRPVSQKIIVKLAESLNVTPAYLMGWEDNEREKKQKESIPDIASYDGFGSASTSQIHDQVEKIHLSEPKKKSTNFRQLNGFSCFSFCFSHCKALQNLAKSG